jgi:hypothetical protein
MKNKKPLYYKLDGVRPVPLESFPFIFQDKETRRVAFTEISKDIEVSTVFIGIDHSHGNSEKPILFETLVFGGEMDGVMRRYSSWFEAEQGHQLIVDKIRKSISCK